MHPPLQIGLSFLSYNVPLICNSDFDLNIAILNRYSWRRFYKIDAQESARLQIELTLKKTRFFDKFKNQLNQRQIKVINRMLQEGYGSFEGGMNAKKYMSITSTSKATSTRDLQDLHKKGIFIPKGAGRSTSYNLNLDAGQ